MPVDALKVVVEQWGGKVENNQLVLPVIWGRPCSWRTAQKGQWYVSAKGRQIITLEATVIQRHRASPAQDPICESGVLIPSSERDPRNAWWRCSSKYHLDKALIHYLQQELSSQRGSATKITQQGDDFPPEARLDNKHQCCLPLLF